jgi:hypothetical protein
MYKKIVAIIFSTLMFAMIPIAAGIPTQTSTADGTGDTGFFGRTIITGIIIGYHEQGFVKTFTAVFCHYTIMKPLQQPYSGFYVMKHLTFIRKFTGYHGLFIINGIFRGTPFF